MADKTTVTSPSGRAGAPDPNQYPPTGSDAIFGGPLPTGTGAPGTAGASGSADATNEPGQVSDGLTGVTEAEITQTGAPGSAGSPAGDHGSASVTYTRPNDGIGPYEQVSGGSDGTEANADGYAGGGPKMPGIAEPTSTGAGKGNVMRGGRNVRG